MVSCAYVWAAIVVSVCIHGFSQGLQVRRSAWQSHTSFFKNPFPKGLREATEKLWENMILN